MLKNAIIMKTGFSRSQPTNWGFYKLILIDENDTMKDTNFQGAVPIKMDIIDVLKQKKIKIFNLGCNHGKVEGIHEQNALKYSMSKDEVITWIEDNS